MNRITEEDIPQMRKIFDDELSQKYMPELRILVHSNQGIMRLLSSFDALVAQDEGLIWGIRLDGVLIGFVAIMDMSYNPTIFYAMHPSYRTMGYMKECVNQAIQHIFESTLCQYLQSEVYLENEISIKLLLSVGFNKLKKDNTKMYLRIDAGQHTNLTK